MYWSVLEPSIDAAHIGVTAEGGVIILTATLPPTLKNPYGTHITAHNEIAKRPISALAWRTTVPRDAVTARVQNGWVTLER
ncbi:hypothetical protein ATY79_00310 [Rhizobium sp. R693]|nr:hypothetical protein ATY79_00310 [Rhizobium sp. R693]